MSEDKVGSLVEEALKRKERLQALKKKNEEAKDINADSPSKLPMWVIKYFSYFRYISL